MYASITTNQMQPERLDEAAAVWRDLYPDDTRTADVQGLRGSHFLVDRATGQIAIVGLWETEVAARAFETSGAMRQRAERLAEYTTGTPERRVYEVAASVGGKP